MDELCPKLRIFHPKVLSPKGATAAKPPNVTRNGIVHREKTFKYLELNFKFVKDLLRQIADLIAQAEQINIDNAKSKLKEFSKFNNEMKSYLNANINDQDIVNIAKEIPDLNEEIEPDKSLSSFLVGLLTDGGSNYLETAEESDDTMRKVEIIKGKYSSIEMLLKNSQ